MSQEKKDRAVQERPILIVSDSADEVRAVRELLKNDCDRIFGADDEENGLRLFQERKPGLLILNFTELEGSERFYLTLYRQCPTIRELPHQTLLLCKVNETETAFSLCQKGTLDDYLVNRPLHDPLRLRLAVHHALARQAGKTQASAVNSQLSNIGSDLRHFDQFISSTLASGKNLQADALQTFREFSGKLGRELERFETRMSSLAQGPLRSNEHDKLCQQFHELRSGNVEPATRQIEDKLQGAQAWGQQLDTSYREEIDRLIEQEFPSAQVEIALVDDDEVYREMLGIMLEEVGFRVFQYESGEAALVDMRRRRPSIVLLDYQMPGLGGLGTLREMKVEAELRQVPVVMLTGANARETVREVVMNGAAGFLVKPSNRPIIIAKIEEVLSAAGKPGSMNTRTQLAGHDVGL